MLGVLLGVAGFCALVLWNLPAPYNPFAPLELSHEPTFATPLKQRWIAGDPAACRAVMEKEAAREGGISYAHDAIISKQEGCGALHALRLLQGKLNYGGGVRLACPAMVSLLLWERHEVMPAAQEILSSPVKRVLHYGTYSCRNVNNAEEGRRSKHASAAAIDVAGFQLEDGRRITVLEDWGKETPEGEFLARVHEGACGLFGGVLGPDYNDKHKDHFHFELSGWGYCR